ncbi:pyridoxal phosphate-dependent aminotransferase [Salinimicrobium sediminilitoris]|uniref:pyridoxal phosphate-dependent aminotransferase n=1 Tax=Salinimicrobium sediminilitoris TaxID=2876715 RepID=UPI001E65A442|nr:aminotransferase class I/II-fold pyridoxal phosphate-dependent enzyme [Salinimicrobium sediminilitoris]MCC8360084.1 aminotransferase class I/II-fold pyridoxal phosphate-dependent enzyme [Salinimicrobium sediminilitoris]
MIAQASRLNHVEEYYFSTKLKEVRALQDSGKPIINLGVGSPDLAPPPQVMTALQKALLNPDAHQYQPYRGTNDFRKAIAEFYQNFYNVDLNSETEILPLMGSKEGITHISMAFLNEGDEVLVPNPGYPTYAAVSRLVGASTVLYDLSEETGWLPNFEQLEKRDLSSVKLMWVNYPNMPTGAVAKKAIFEQLIAFGKKHSILIVNDNPYSFILNEEPESILKYADDTDGVLELNSLSKSFNMSGWRIGMLCGSEKHINSVLKVKTNMDSGMFFPLQAGAAMALRLPPDWFREQNKIYLRRKEEISILADALDCSFTQDQTGMFLWCRVPRGITSEAFVDHLLKQYHIFVAPGFIFGSQGEGYIRFSLCSSEETIIKACKRLSA